MKAKIDRIENGFAVILAGDEELKMDVPLTLLPSGAKEGSLLNISFELDPGGEKLQREKIAGLLEKLRNKNG